MRTRLLKALFAVCVLLFLTGGFLYMSRNQKPERVKKQYDTYMAQLDDLILVDVDGMLLITEEWVDDPEFNAIYEKSEKARNYLIKHAPHLLPSAETSEESYKESSEAFLKSLRKVDPEAAAELEAGLAQSQHRH